ncbi:MAG: MBL fold metallo-hydrolase, partial [Kiritimatiellae bacterium]|nr:MBL fold metallo-hydrolase [Kiritimatiellia bacterium]
MNRRIFMKSAALAPFFGALGVCGSSSAQENREPAWCGKGHPLAGKRLPPWKPGEFQVHFIYTGVAESMFWIMPDGTTMLLDCGDHAAWMRGKLAIWILPNGRKNAGEWVARYVARVNPAKTYVDYMMLSHHHSDHGGGERWGAGTREWNGQKIRVSGFMQAADTLKFGTAFDRGWPDFNDPIPDERCDSDCYGLMRKVYPYLMERDGIKMEKFVVGARNQVAMRKDAAAYPSFSVTNITGNGKILCRNGPVRDLYAELHDAKRLNENGMSLGLLVQYGPFRFYTAGDFSDSPKLPDGSRRNIEAELARELDPVDVAKVNHHGLHSLPAELVAALQARVWTACMWDLLHITADSL